MSEVCTACIPVYTGVVFFHVFLKFKRGMATVSSMTTQLHVHNSISFNSIPLALCCNFCADYKFCLNETND